MSSTTAKLKIPYGWAANEDPGTEPLDRHRKIVDAAAPSLFSQDVAATSGLTYGYLGGIVITGGALTKVAGGTIALTNNATNYVERTGAGVVSVNTSGWTSGKYAMAKVVTASGAITSVEDWRAFSQVANP